MSCIDSHSAEETRQLGARLGQQLCGGDVIGLIGELGSGKTCLVQGIARGMGVDPQIPVTSPTFTLVGEYPGELVLRHADFYRVESYARLEDAGFDDLLDSKAVLVVEWPERFPDVLPAERLEIAIAFVSDSERRLRFGGKGERARELIRSLFEPCR